MSETPIPSKPFVNLQDVATQPHIVFPQQISTVHADDVKVTIDRQTNTITLSLFTMHILPKLEPQRWQLDNLVWDLVGEIKIPMTIMDLITIYYLSEKTRLNVASLIQKELERNPQPPADASKITFGPTGVVLEQTNESKK